MRIFQSLVVELLYLVLSLLIGWGLADIVNIAPRFLRAKNAALSASELMAILSISLAVGAPVFLLYNARNKSALYLDSRRTVSEIYAISLVFALAMSIVFITGTINFSLNFFMLSFFVLVCLVLVSFVVLNLKRARSATHPAVRSWGLEFLLDLIRSPFSWPSLAVIVVVLVPIGLALAYKKDEDIRNSINLVRLYFNQGAETRWALEKVFPHLNFRQPIDLDFSPTEPSEIFVLERAGRIFKLSDWPDSDRELVLDFQDNVGRVSGENGAVGFALDPGFGNSQESGNGFVYVYYTHVRPDSQHNRLSRFDLSLPSLEERLASELILIEQQRSTGGSHNGGSVEFGPDSFLYLALGDAADNRNRQVIDRDLFSGIIRIDVHQQGGNVSHPILRQPVNGKTQGYFIPNDNPFAGKTGVLEEFWAIGLRNPFRISIDRGTGDIWTGDVGWNRFEEVNLVRKGGNYQWPFMEGPMPNPKATRPANVLGVETPPFYSYAHTGLERVIIGGILYRGDKFSELRGRYIFADNFSGRVSALDPRQGPGGEPETLAFAEQLNIVGITSFKETPKGDIYLTTLGGMDAEAGNVLQLTKIAKGDAASVAEVEASGTGDPVEVTFETAERTFSSICAYCHGDEGKGDGSGLEASDVKAPDFTSPEWQRSRTDDFLIKAIQKGGAAVGLSSAMPSWEGALSEEEIEMLVKVLRSLEAGT